jgi:hypothetical protein
MITAKTLVLRGKAVLVDGSRVETWGGNDQAIGHDPALVSVRHLSLGCQPQSYGQPGQGGRWAYATPLALRLGEPRFAGVQCRKPATAMPWQQS